MINRTSAVVIAATGNTMENTASTSKATTSRTGDANDPVGTDTLATLAVLGLAAAGVATLKEKKGKFAR